MITGYI